MSVSGLIPTRPDPVKAFDNHDRLEYTLINNFNRECTAWPFNGPNTTMTELLDMIADFLDAHHRHWDDAEFLFNEARLANADHHYGMAAECGLKRLMIAFGMGVKPEDGSPIKHKDRFHADKAWNRYESYRSGRLSFTLPSDDPFNDWSISQRYASREHFTRERTESHRSGARTVRVLIKKAVWEGVL